MPIHQPPSWPLAGGRPLRHGLLFGAVGIAIFGNELSAAAAELQRAPAEASLAQAAAASATQARTLKDFSWDSVLQDEQQDAGLPEAVPEPPLPPADKCPPGYYRESAIVWTCVGQRVGSKFQVPAQQKRREIQVPRGIKDLSIYVWTHDAARLEVSDPHKLDLQGASTVLVGAQAGVVHGSITTGTFDGVNIVYTGGVGNETVHFEGTLSDSLIIGLDNSGSLTDANVVIIVEHSDVDACPFQYQPVGCGVYVDPVATQEVTDWSCWMVDHYNDATLAWQAIGAPHARPHLGAQAVPWHVFGNVWDSFRTDPDEVSWQYAFKKMDLDDDMFISMEEFKAGFGYCGGGGASTWSLDTGHVLMLLLLAGSAGALALYTMRESKSASSCATHCSQRCNGSDRAVALKGHTADAEAQFEESFPAARSNSQVPAPVAPVSPASPASPAMPKGQRACCAAPKEQRACGRLGLGRWFDCGGRAKREREAMVAAQMQAPKPESLSGGYAQMHQRPAALPVEMGMTYHQLASGNYELERQRAPPAHPFPQAQHPQPQAHHPPPQAQQRPPMHQPAPEAQPMMQAHSDVELERSQSEAATAAGLRHLAGSRDPREQVQAALGMARMAKDGEAKADAFESLALGARQGGAAQTLVRHEVIRTVVQALAEHKNDQLLQAAGCWVLWALCKERGEDGQAVADSTSGGGLESVLIAMAIHPQSFQVQEAGIAALWQMALEGPSRSIICARGGIELVREAMYNHAAMMEVQENACNALGNLVIESDALEYIDRDLVSAVVKAMRQYPADAGVQEAGTYALYNFISTADCYGVVAELGGVEVVKQAMNMHPSVAEMEEGQVIVNQGY